MTTESEMILLDTNVLVYALDAESSHHVRSRLVLERAARGDGSYCVTSQTLAEFFSVITNPRRVRVPCPAIEAVESIEKILALPGIMHLVAKPEATIRWLELTRQIEVRGAEVFDLQLAATALDNGVNKICALNVHDFERIVGIEAVTP